MKNVRYGGFIYILLFFMNFLRLVFCFLESDGRIYYFCYGFMSVDSYYIYPSVTTTIRQIMDFLINFQASLT